MEVTAASLVPQTAAMLAVGLSGEEAVAAQWRGRLRRGDLRRGRCDLRELVVELPDLVLAPEGGAEAVVGDRRHHEELRLRRRKLIDVAK
jgi:hypothetical protein